MPTENRSSNTEMVSVPRVLTREMLNGVCMHPDLARSLWAALLKNAPQPTDHPQGKPVTLPSCTARLTESHDWDQGYRDGWNACLDEIATLGPLYTHADPNVRWKAVADEQMQVIAGLRTELAGTIAESKRRRNCCADLIDERDTLRAQLATSNDARETLNAQLRAAHDKLAERDALLERVVDHAKFWHDHPYAEVVEAIAKDYKALSASAEPQVKS